MEKCGVFALRRHSCLAISASDEFRVSGPSEYHRSPQNTQESITRVHEVINIFKLNMKYKLMTFNL